tara:strand:- start:120 stop:338 length:219 start_codon:yes stop_codon:yes gene_type:complete
MLISLDNVAQRYGVLPSVALKQGTTVDLLVLQTASKYADWQQTDEYKNNKGKTVKELQRMVDGVSNNGKNKR